MADRISKFVDGLSEHSKTLAKKERTKKEESIERAMHEIFDILGFKKPDFWTCHCGKEVPLVLDKEKKAMVAKCEKCGMEMTISSKSKIDEDDDE